MPDVYRQLLDATILHLEEQKTAGVKFVAVSPETMAAWVSPVNRSAPVPAPAAPVQTARTAASMSTSASPPVLLPIPSRTESIEKSPPALDPDTKARLMANLRERALACQKCAHLARSRQNVVFGVGDINAQLMFVGEAPGADEDVQGEPFVGRAGQLLTRIIQTMGFSRETVYIANILKCRPDTPAQSSGNRKPTPEEMNTCLPYLQEQIDLIQPKVLVALGGTAVQGLLGQTVSITRFRGNWQTFRAIPLMPTYHPSYLLHNQSLALKREVWEDMLLVMEKLGAPISDKQRNYFLSP